MLHKLGHKRGTSTVAVSLGELLEFGYVVMSLQRRLIATLACSVEDSSQSFPGSKPGQAWSVFEADFT
jgi:hypothetical protein